MFMCPDKLISWLLNIVAGGMTTKSFSVGQVMCKIVLGFCSYHAPIASWVLNETKAISPVPTVNVYYYSSPYSPMLK